MKDEWTTLLCMLKSRRVSLIPSMLLITLTGLLLCKSVMAATPEGSVIRNQASATYRDASGVERFTTSNIVETTIQQAAGVQLSQDQNKLTASGGQVSFPHVLTNTGNGSDTFMLSASNAVGVDYFYFTSIRIYADVDQNGVADSIVEITETPVLTAGESFNFTVVAMVPGATGAADTGRIDVGSTSTFNTGKNALNADSVTVTTAAFIEVVKSMSMLGGESPGGPFTVTLSYRNDSATDASNVTLIDALPAGMSYVAGSGRWSVTDSLVLSDNNAYDVQGSTALTIRYCAYDSGCEGLPEAGHDSDSSSINQVTAILNEVGAGNSGTLQFDVDIDPALDYSDLINTAEFEYDGGVGTTARVSSNSVSFGVTQVVAVVANGSDTNAADGAAEPVIVTNANQGAIVAFDHVIWNTGNGTDTFDIVTDSSGSTFPADSIYQLFRSDGLTPLVDSSGNGVADTGPLVAGASYGVVLKINLPPDAQGNNGGAGFGVSSSAQSVTDPNVSNRVEGHLDMILPGTVDLTNNAVAGDAAALGENAGPEVEAQVIKTVAPGGITRFSLYASNIGSIEDAFDIAVSTDASFNSEVLPAGWSVSFRASTDTRNISNTGVVSASTATHFYADVSVPANQAPADQSLYFRILSPSTGALDILHDVVSVNNPPALLIEPDSNGQLEPGGAIVYTHQLANHGNAIVAPISLTAVDSLATAGWVSSLYEDTNGDGVFGATDTVVSTISSLSPGMINLIFVKVSAPANASFGAANVTRLTVSWDTGSESVGISNVTTVATGDIGIVKEQALDIACDDVLDGPYTREPFAVEPGNNCVRYRLTATNAGVEPLYNAIIQDATPAFTVYRPSATCSATACTITEPDAGSTGLVAGEVATVAPGESVEFTFAVIIE